MTERAKDELARAVHQKVQITKRDATLAVDEVFHALARMLAEGRDVGVSGFGKFAVKEQKPRQGRNPKTGEPVAIPAKRVVLFRSSASLKGAVNKEAP